MLYVPSRNQATVIPLYAPDPALGATVAYTHGAPEDQRLARRGAIRPEPRMPQGLPLLKPLYSRMTAIDLNAGEHARRHEQRPAPGRLRRDRRGRSWRPSTCRRGASGRR